MILTSTASPPRCSRRQRVTFTAAAAAVAPATTSRRRSALTLGGSAPSGKRSTSVPLPLVTSIRGRRIHEIKPDLIPIRMENHDRDRTLHCIMNFVFTPPPASGGTPGPTPGGSALRRRREAGGDREAPATEGLVRGEQQLA